MLYPPFALPKRMKNIIWFTLFVVMLSGCSGCSHSGRKLRNQQNRLASNSGGAVTIDTAQAYTPPVTSSAPKEISLTDIVAKAEPCVFVVKTYDRKGKGVGQGTGFFIEENGIGVSNYHVFEGGKTWQIRTFDGKQYEVEKIIKQNETFDYVIFQVKTHDVSFLPLASDKPRKGEDIVVLGNPRGLESTVSRGIVSSIRNFKRQKDALIQIDAAISPGSSGSPVMNMRGEVVGIATMQIEKCENCNFAFNIDMLSRDDK